MKGELRASRSFSSGMILHNLNNFGKWLVRCSHQKLKICMSSVIALTSTCFRPKIGMTYGPKALRLGVEIYLMFVMQNVIY